MFQLYQKAIDDFSTVLLYFSKDYVFALRGSCQIKLKNTIDAINDYTLAIKLNPSKSHYYRRGKIYYISLHDTIRAASDFKRVLELDKDSTFFSAAAYCFLGKKDTGFELQNKIIGTSSNVKIDYYNMACLYSLMGEENYALIYLNLALKSGYDNYNWLRNDDDFANIRDTPAFKTFLFKNNIPSQ